MTDPVSDVLLGVILTCVVLLIPLLAQDPAVRDWTARRRRTRRTRRGVRG